MTPLRTLSRTLTLALLSAAATACLAQQPADAPATTPAPKSPSPATAPPAAAPIVRLPPKPAAAAVGSTGSAGTTGTTAAPHLTVARPVVKTPTTAASGSTSSTGSTPSTTPVKPKPATPKPAAAATPAALAPVPPAGPAPVTMNRSVIVLDPAHGGADTGSRINDSVTEKDITLALAFRLRSLLAARGFTVIMTRDTDAAFVTPEKGATASTSTIPGTPLSLDDRAGIADHARPVACLLLHATASGSGVHLYTSELNPAPGEPALIPWLTAQAAWVPQSQRLANQLGTALTRARIPLVLSTASVRPVDSLTCPALVVELAPNNADTATLTDGGYQGRVAEAIATALVFWQSQAQPPVKVDPPAPPPPPTPDPAAPTPAPTPKPKPPTSKPVPVPTPPPSEVQQ